METSEQYRHVVAVARIIARHHGARVVEVERYTRPWDVVGDYYDDRVESYEQMAVDYGFEEYR